MTLRQIERAAVGVGGVILCTGIGAMTVDFYIGAAIIAGACVLILAAGLWIHLRERESRKLAARQRAHRAAEERAARAEAAARQAMRAVGGRYLAEHELVDAARLLDDVFPDGPAGDWSTRRSRDNNWGGQ